MMLVRCCIDAFRSREREEGGRGGGKAGVGSWFSGVSRALDPLCLHTMGG